MSRQDRHVRATILDVARAAGVSRQTVSNAVNNPERVRPDTLVRVLDEVERLGYRPSSAAQTLRQSRAGAIGTELNAVSGTVSDVALPFLVELTLAAPRYGCHLVPFADPGGFPTVAGYRDMVRRRLVDAFVLTDTRPGDARTEWLHEDGIPFSSFGRVYDLPAFTSWADVDGRWGTAEAVEHLVRRGYATVAFLGWPAGSAVGDDRRRGWREALLRRGMPEGPVAEAPQRLPEATRAGDLLLGQLGPGDAVVCASDVLALGVYEAACARGLALGRDLGVVGFDGSPPARLHGITTLVQPLREIAYHLLALLHDQLAGTSPPAAGTLFRPVLTPDRSTDRSPQGKAQL